eukprot:gene10713-gene247
MCGGHGSCDAGSGECSCSGDWVGSDCSTQCSGDLVCGGHGICDNTDLRNCICSNCKCDDGY